MKLTGLITLLIALICNMSYSQTKWIDVKTSEQIAVNGLPWYQQNDRQFIRLPLVEKDNITPAAWWMSKCPSGARVRFKTDSSSLKLRICHGMENSDRLAMWHMSSVAVSGIDLYIGPPENMTFWKTTNPQSGSEAYEHIYFENLAKKTREFTLYLPTYAELSELSIGINDDATLATPTPYQYEKPIVFYGTSITQGACAGRGANTFVSRISRQLNCDVVNLGFSGSGCGEPIMAELMSQIDASIYVIDSVANMNTKIMQERYENLIGLLRKNKPETPIVLMTKIHFAYEVEPAQAQEYIEQHKPLFETYEKMKAAGDKNIYLFDAGAIIPTGKNHPTADGIHMLDTGFEKITGQLAPSLGQILNTQPE